MGGMTIEEAIVRMSGLPFDALHRLRHLFGQSACARCVTHLTTSTDTTEIESVDFTHEKHLDCTLALDLCLEGGNPCTITHCLCDLQPNLRSEQQDTTVNQFSQ